MSQEYNAENDEMIGKRFGRLVVVKLDEEVTANNKNKAKSYVCKCDCGNTKTVRKANLRSGSTTSCGCKVKESCKRTGESGFIDLVGQKFGKLTVTRRKENDKNDPVKQRRNGAWWYTDCDCGTKDFVAKGAYLRAGRVVSCGCYNKEASHDKNTIDLTGQRFGMLTVLEEVQCEKGKNRSARWKCVCDCGNTAIVKANSLKSGDTISCGCISSKNEKIIRDHLRELGIRHKKQFHFDDLRSPITGRLLKFDVSVFDDNDILSFLIEYDGEQHEYGVRFAPTEQQNREKFERLKLHDETKNQYCKDHNIDLLRISFRDKKDLIAILDNKLKEKGLLKDGI